MIKGASGRQSVDLKGTLSHNQSEVPAPKQMKVQNDRKMAGSDSVMRHMSMNKTALKGQC